MFFFYKDIKEWFAKHWRKILGVTFGGMILSGAGLILFDNPPASSTGSCFPSAHGTTYDKWINPENVYGDGYATGYDDSPRNEEDYYNFDIVIPDGATITGIGAQVYGELGSGSSVGLDIKLSGDNGVTWTDAKSDTWTGVETNTYGSSSDLWGESWVSGNFSNANFSMYCKVTGDRSCMYINSMKVTIYFMAGAPLFSNPSPSNNAVNVDIEDGIGVNCSLNITDSDGDTFNVEFMTDCTPIGSWVNVSDTQGQTNGTHYFLFQDFNELYTTYYWRVKSTDSDNESATSSIYTFTTKKIYGKTDYYPPDTVDASSCNFPTECFISDNDRAQFSGTEYLHISGFSLDSEIPQSCVIKGIVVQFEGYCSSGSANPNIELSFDGGASWASSQSTTFQEVTYETTGIGEHYYYVGNYNDLWGSSGLTHSNFTDNNFRVNITNTKDSLLIDQALVEVYYNASPDITPTYPENNSINISIYPTCKALAEHGNGTVTVTWASNASGSLINYYTQTDVKDEVVAYVYDVFTEYDKDYWWVVYADDGETNVSKTYKFTTCSDIPSSGTYDILCLVPINSGVNERTPPEEYIEWKEGNTTHSCILANEHHAIYNNTFWVDGYWGDNNTNNPFYYSQTISDESLYNTTQHQLRNMIRYFHENRSVDYVVLFNDSFPKQNFCWYLDGYRNDYGDLNWYGCLNSTQNIWDNQDYYGLGLGDNDSIYDKDADVYMGRFPFNDNDEWENMFNKTKNWEVFDNSEGFFSNFIILDRHLTNYSLSIDDLWANYSDTTRGIEYTTTLGAWVASGHIDLPNGNNEADGMPLEKCINLSQMENISDYFNGSVAGWTDGFNLYLSDTHTDMMFDNVPTSTWMDLFDNADHPFIHIPMACGGGQSGTLSGILLRAEGGVVFYPGVGESFTHAFPATAYINGIFENNVTMGEAAESAWNKIYSIASDRRLFNINGDPTLTFKYPEYPALWDFEPKEGAYNFLSEIVINCSVQDYQADLMTVYYLTNISGSWEELTHFNDVTSDTDISYNLMDNISDSIPQMKKYVSVNVTDGNYWTNMTHIVSVWFGCESPANESTTPSQPTCSIIVYGNSSLNVTFATNESNGVDWINVQTNSSVNSGDTVRWDFVNADTIGMTYYWRICRNDTSGNNVSKTYHFFIPFNTTVRTDGVDYFVWLGSNWSAWHVKDAIGTTFNEAGETISILNNTGHWDNYTGAGGGNNFSIHTFDVVKIVLDDGAGTLTFNMTGNSGIDYDATRTVTLTKVGNGYNFTGWTNSTSTTLSAENTTLSLTTGYFIALWNETNYNWDYWISGFGITNKNIHQYDVVMTKIATTKNNWQVG